MEIWDSGEEAMLTRTIDVRKEPPDLKGLLSLVADGTEVVLTEGDTPIARLVPVGKRVTGLHAGAIWTSEDFDEPLPDEFWTGNA
jgi:antitoxin (DNA-binding transcriptional repressor) of toxin-antitoxin stability system